MVYVFAVHTTVRYGCPITNMCWYEQLNWEYHKNNSAHHEHSQEKNMQQQQRMVH